MNRKLGRLMLASTLLLASPASALDVDGYLDMKIKALINNNEAERALRQGIITGYFQGVGESLEDLAIGDLIEINSVRICKPQKTRLSAEVVQAATDEEVEEWKAGHRENLKMPDWRKKSLAAFSIMGLQTMFPCK